MSLSSKSRKEFGKLKTSADSLWGQQQEILGQAGSVLQDAARQLNSLAKDEVAPLLAKQYEESVKPGLDKGYESAGKLAAEAKTRFAKDIAPALASAVGSAASLVKSLRKGKAAAAAPAPVAAVAKSGLGVGGYIAIGAGVTVAAAVGYVLWQTFRADDELWISEEDETPTSEV